MSRVTFPDWPTPARYVSGYPQDTDRVSRPLNAHLAVTTVRNPLSGLEIRLHKEAILAPEPEAWCPGDIILLPIQFSDRFAQDKTTFLHTYDLLTVWDARQYLAGVSERERAGKEASRVERRYQENALWGRVLAVTCIRPSTRQTLVAEAFPYGEGFRRRVERELQGTYDPAFRDKCWHADVGRPYRIGRVKALETIDALFAHAQGAAIRHQDAPSPGGVRTDSVQQLDDASVVQRFIEQLHDHILSETSLLRDVHDSAVPGEEVPERVLVRASEENASRDALQRR